MVTPFLKKTIAISALGHLTIFSIFSLSFGNRILPADYSSIYFLGQFLRTCQSSPPKLTINRYKSESPIFRESTLALGKVKQNAPLLDTYYLKPALPLISKTPKVTFIKEEVPYLLPPRRNEPTIIFHPLLPYSFTLYFKDRQIAHVELMFNIATNGIRDSIEIKRKISSGNLEVDLLSCRYIGRYLFMQQVRFKRNNWQTVKINLSGKAE
jgi:hypothetical protein